jgi:DNA mismatch endonuclease (patch repair protein)
MSRVRGRGNRSTEARVASTFRTSGVRGWRRHLQIAGSPDFYFPEARLAVFVHGCFWHGCLRCKRRAPSTNRAFWKAKIEGNRRRDRRSSRALRSAGVAVVTVWEHELGSDKWLTRVVKRLS